MNTKVARGLLIALLCFLLLFAIIPLFKQSEYVDREIVVQESLQCITAVCVSETSVGEECRYLNAFVSKLIVTVDPNDSEKRIVRVQPTKADCR